MVEGSGLWEHKSMVDSGHGPDTEVRFPLVPSKIRDIRNAGGSTPPLTTIQILLVHPCRVSGPIP